MGTQIRILRKKQFCGSGSTCKIEIDGALIGQVKSGAEFAFELNEGVHRFRFIDSFDRVLRTGTLTVNGEKDILINIQYNISTGKLDVLSKQIVCEDNQQKDPRKMVCGTLLAFATICIVAVLIICIMSPESFEGTSTNNSPTISANTQTEYLKVDLQDMLDELRSNALRAEETYQNKYIEITGVIKVFDSDGKYIAIVPYGASNWSFETVQCYLTDTSHKAFLLEKSVGDVVTIRGKVFSVGEVLGYSVRIAEIGD